MPLSISITIPMRTSISITMTITKVGDEHLHCAMARCDSIDALKVFY